MTYLSMWVPGAAGPSYRCLLAKLSSCRLKSVPHELQALHKDG